MPRRIDKSLCIRAMRWGSGFLTRGSRNSVVNWILGSLRAHMIYGGG
jgi:hypothetical protein